MSKPKFDAYPFELRPLTKAEGGGWLITWPSLPGCMSDGETPEAAIENGKDFEKFLRKLPSLPPLPGDVRE